MSWHGSRDCPTRPPAAPATRGSWLAWAEMFHTPHSLLSTADFYHLGISLCHALRAFLLEERVRQQDMCCDSISSPKALHSKYKVPQHYQDVLVQASMCTQTRLSGIDRVCKLYRMALRRMSSSFEINNLWKLRVLFPSRQVQN
jgi:hypothetical protein